MTPRSAAIVGLGTIGGSIALALTRAGWTVRGDAINARDRAAAYRRGIYIAPGAGRDRIENLTKLVEMVVLSVPPGELARVAAEVAAVVPASVPILHTCSIQSPKALRLPAELARRLTPTHPMAGAAGRGFIAAREDLFVGCQVSVAVPASLASRKAAVALWKAVGAREILACHAEEHDQRMRYVSHLPQLAATALAAALHDAGVPATALGPGGRDTTRLATSPWPLWHALLAINPKASANPIRLLEAELHALRVALEHGDMEKVGRIWRSAASWRSGEDVAPFHGELPAVDTPARAASAALGAWRAAAQAVKKVARRVAKSATRTTKPSAKKAGTKAGTKAGKQAGKQAGTKAGKKAVKKRR